MASGYKVFKPTPMKKLKISSVTKLNLLIKND